VEVVVTDPNRKIIVDGVEFREILHFPRIFRSVLSALQPPRLVIALFMILLLVSLGRLWDGVTGDRCNAFPTLTTVASGGFSTTVQGVYSLSPTRMLSGMRTLVVDLPMGMWSEHKIFTIVFGLLFVLITAVGGAAIARMTAVHTATHRRLSVRDAMRFSFTRWVRMVLAPLIPFIAATIIGLIVVVMGVLMLVPVLNIIGGMLYIIALLLGLLFVFLLLVYVLAFVMVVPALAVEDCDGADAQQRAYGYVLSKPLHMVSYIVLGVIGLALGFFVVSTFATAVLHVTPALYSTFQGENPSPAFAVTQGVSVFGTPTVTAEDVEAKWHHATAGWFINLWQILIISIVWAYVVSYFFSASTTIYLLMRRACDGQDIEEIWEAS